ncbi:MAG: ABC transporter permease [Firmicutes bacterium]|nr:ABC transporter permease [Bacillota bacterium]
MARYIIKRILYMFLVLFIVVSTTFIMVHSIPGDPLTATVENLPAATRANYYARYGLDKPLMVQLFRFWKLFLTEGSLGESLKYPGRMAEEFIIKYAPVSFRLGIWGLVIGVCLGMMLGITAALHKNKLPDYFGTFVALLGTCIPAFVLAALVQYFFTVKHTWFPTAGWGGAIYYVLPVLCMTLSPVATYCRYMKSTVLDVINQDYILTAESKGLRRGTIIWRHVMRNTLMPIVTMLAPSVAGLLGGSFIIESMFAIPGLGTYFVKAINSRDYTMVVAMNFLFTATYVFSLLVVDLLYLVIDPRVRLEVKQNRRAVASNVPNEN